MKVSVILPCRNEEQTIGICIKKIQKTLEGKDYEIIVSDSSIDKSAEIAKSLGVKLIKHDKEGYGNAYLEGLKHAKGSVIVMGDSDDTYDFTELPKLLGYIDDYDFVIGRRKFIHSGAMSFSHRYIGNPLLSFILGLFFKTKIKDINSGFRVIKKEGLDKLNLQTTGMEFASEMIIKAIKNNLRIKEVDINYYKRKGKSKLHSFRDGWRHLRFMLLYSPLFLFFIPGIILFFIGLISLLYMYFNQIDLFGIKLFYHPLFFSSLLIIIGYQLVIFSLFAKTYAINHLGEKPILNKFYKYVSIESVSIFGLSIIIAGIVIYSLIFSKWINTGFGNFGLEETKNTILAFILVIVGIQTIFSSFMLSILGIKK